MKQIYYALRSFVRDREANFIKIISLTLGLFIGILIFSRLAFSYSYNGDYKEPDHLFIINETSFIGDQVLGPSPIIVAPLPAAIWEYFPEFVESATITYYNGMNNFFRGEQNIGSYEMSYADPFYFRTMGIEVIKGDPEELTNPDVIFISRSLARKIYGEADPIGQVLNLRKNIPMTVKGVFEDVQENSSFPHDVVGSFITMKTRYERYAGWDGDDSYIGFVRLKRASDAALVEKRLNDLIESMYKSNYGEMAIREVFELQPIQDYYLSNPNVRKMIMILGGVGTIVLLISIMNYILITLSSFPLRAKSIGVHKCNGASQKNIFMISLWETLFIILISLLLAVFLMFQFREVIQDIIDVSFSGIFSGSNSWIILSLIIFIFCIIGILPGVIFSRISVINVFRQQLIWKTQWKRPLLFIQFASIAFITGLLCVVLEQQLHLVNKDLGYEPKNVYYANFYDVHTGPEPQILVEELKRLPSVENAGMAYMGVGNIYLSGEIINDESGKSLFSTRWDVLNDDYISVTKLKLVAGKDAMGVDEVLINEEYARRMNWKDPVGKLIRTSYSSSPFKVTGVVKDYPVQSYYESQLPLLLYKRKEMKEGVITIRVKETSTQTFNAIDQKLKEMYPMEDISLEKLTEKLDRHNQEVINFKNTVTIAFIFILIMMMMGLLGYVNDELRRRTKEIAIRKVNGGETVDILKLLARSIGWILTPSILVGLVLAGLIGEKWLTQFVERIELNISFLLLVGILLFVLIICSVIIKSWYVANSNPVNNLRSE